MSPTLAKLERKIMEVLSMEKKPWVKRSQSSGGKRQGEDVEGEEAFLYTFLYLTFESCDCTILPKFLK